MENIDINPLKDIINNYLLLFSEDINSHIPILEIYHTPDYDESQIDIYIISKDFVDKTINHNFIHALINNIKIMIDTIYDSRYSKYIGEDYIEVDTINGKISIHLSIEYEPTINNKLLVTGNNDISNKPKITKEILDQIYNSIDSWDLVYKDRSIDINKVEKYIQSIKDPYIQDIARTIINNSKYVNYHEFKYTMINQVEKLPDQFNLYFDVTGTKVGSEHWLVMILWPWIKDKIYKVINVPEDIDSNIPLVIIDDAMYSGQQMINLLEYIVEHFNFWDVNKEEIIQPLTNQVRTKNKFFNTNIILVLGYVNNVALVKLDEYSKLIFNTDYAHIHVYTDNILNNIYQYLNSYYTPETLTEFIDIMRKHFNIMDTNMGLYFDHKIAGIHSSIQFYNEIVKELPSREKIELLKSKLTPYSILYVSLL